MAKTKIKDNEKENINIRASAAASGESALPASRTIDNDPGEDNDYLIYTNNIYSYVDDFIEENYPGISNEELKTNKSFFPLLIQYLYNNYIGHILRNKLDYKMQGIKPQYKDIRLIDSIFNTYINLVYKYKWNNKPFINEFSILTGISRNVIYNWLNGVIDNYILDSYTDNDKRRYITSEYCDTVRKWQVICEQSLVDGSGEYIKEIFLLKSLYHYKEDNAIEINVNHKAVISADTLPDLIGLNDGKM